MDDVELCRRRTIEYAAAWREPGFDPQKLHDMVSGCAYRHELLRTDLKPAEEKILGSASLSVLVGLIGRLADKRACERTWIGLPGRTCGFLGSSETAIVG